MSTDHEQTDGSTGDEREPSAMDGAAGDDRSSETSEPTSSDEAEPQPN